MKYARAGRKDRYRKVRRMRRLLSSGKKVVGSGHITLGVGTWKVSGRWT